MVELAYVCQLSKAAFSQDIVNMFENKIFLLFSNVFVDVHLMILGGFQVLDEKDIDFIKVSDLMLDPENPRLPLKVKRTHREMVDYIAKNTAIEDLMSAIAENGFFPGEPLIVVPSEGDKSKYFVVEGNRRLTAVKLLNNPYDCSNPSTRVKEISASLKSKINVLPVVKKDNRDQVLPYLGYRHITGVKQWDPLAKARYIYQMFRRISEPMDASEKYKVVAKTIGSRKDHIKRSLDALAIYQEIERNDFFEIDGLGEESIKFSVLSTALADDRIGKFVGIVEEIDDQDGGFYQELDPILDEKIINAKAVEEISRWLFEKNKNGETRVGESRNLKYLAAVVDNDRALEAFRSNSPLKVAYRYTSDLRDDFIEYLYQAEGVLSEAASMVANVSFDEESYAVATSISKTIKLIGSNLKAKKKENDDEF